MLFFEYLWFYYYFNQSFSYKINTFSHNFTNSKKDNILSFVFLTHMLHSAENTLVEDYYPEAHIVVDSSLEEEYYLDEEEPSNETK